MNNRNHFITENMKKEDFIWMLTGVLAVGIFIGVVLSCLVLHEAMADSDGWIMCDSYVNIRETPRKNGNELGRLDAGDRIRTDDKVRNGYLHIIDAGTETGDGWVYAGYVIYDEPERKDALMVITGNGRVNARRWVDGPKKARLKPGTVVTVKWLGYDWALTNRGYIRSEYIGVIDDDKK